MEGGGELELNSLEGKLQGGPPPQKRKDNDDLDLALDALRDCDTDFSKFVQVVISRMVLDSLQICFPGSWREQRAMKFYNHHQKCASLGQYLS